MPDIDHALRNRVAELTSLVVRVDNKVDSVATDVNHVAISQRETRSDLQSLRADFLAFVDQAQRTANIQRAEIRVGVVQDQVEHEFGHHKVVRRSATGILQAFDTGLVTADAVQSVSEQLMVQTPRYWLAPALIALAAWGRDDEELCARAVEEAFRRSQSKTSLFFALVTRRQGRLTTSARWLKHYLDVQDPSALGRDFAVVLESVSQGAFGAAGREMVQRVLAGWRELLIDDDAVAAQVARWRKEIETHADSPPAAAYSNLATMSPQWPQLAACLGSARANAPLFAEYDALLREEVRPSERLEDAVDDILDRLVTEYDDDELPLRRELAVNEAIIASNGDLEEAKRASDLANAAREETLDYLTIQSTSALRPSTIGVSRATQKLAVAACSDWFESAHSAYCTGYRSGLPRDVGAAFTTSHSAGAATFSLPEWRASFSRPAAELEASLSAHWDAHTAPFLASLVYDWRRGLVLPAIVVAVVAVLGLVLKVAFGLLLALVVGGIWGFVLHKRKTASERAVANAERAIGQMKHESVVALRAAGAELQDWSTEFRRRDGESAKVTALIQQFALAAHSASSYEMRVVAPEGRS